jgi:hypothetical protein
MFLLKFQPTQKKRVELNQQQQHHPQHPNNTPNLPFETQQHQQNTKFILEYTAGLHMLIQKLHILWITL